jgi:hypothetical protein
MADIGLRITAGLSDGGNADGWVGVVIENISLNSVKACIGGFDSILLLRPMDLELEDIFLQLTNERGEE